MIKIFSIFDAKAEAYISPFYMTHTGQAIRTFTDCVNSPDHQFGAHPEDYTIFELGEFDDSTAHFQLMSTPKPLGNGLEFVDSNHPENRKNGKVGNDTQLQPSSAG